MTYTPSHAVDSKAQQPKAQQVVQDGEHLFLFVWSYKAEVEEGDGSDIDHQGEEHYKGGKT